MVYIRKRKLKRDLKSGRKIYTHYNIEREQRTEDKEHPQSESIAALGSHPSPEDLLEVIESEGLEESRVETVTRSHRTAGPTDLEKVVSPPNVIYRNKSSFTEERFIT
ncbi:hypothetical protein AKJ50_00585 [candidate division MSBL1 archaeon SCGC-AAA382A13]|uniref:Uncharacterized protein n=1 Tax=candidate division MSBL1 archaeon SCGC-AAA382A13 TaxID=1698279 RepID=A0A133VGJ7_9EURY|nr:hypothetical protein AKJ50_00585 [candidate division MSBL1 archaeon SCGC-AAA382A13]